MPQTEAQLEDSLIQRLTTLGYSKITIENADQLKANLKSQLEKHNDVQLSDKEFGKILNYLDKGNIFQRSKRILADGPYALKRDDETTAYIEFINTTEWCRNQYQVTNQVTIYGKYENRYDVTLLINGLPLVQIELKRRGMEIKEAFNQIKRYHRHSYGAEGGLFNYIQIFVISNGVNTKYFSNNRNWEFKQTFFWADEKNNIVTQLDEFADKFLEKCHLSKMISKYIVHHESYKVLMVLRPYQYYAVEAIVKRVENSRKNGYIWHTTGSGKTLTSYKAAQILTAYPKVHKVVFVVDRADLDDQTTKEFNHFSDGCVDGTKNTRSLVKQMSGENKLIVTTIQKLNAAISKDRYESSMSELKDKRVVFIFDECHRSQFGETHKNITNFFSRAQMFGFTGTPIFTDNATSNEHGKRTTKDLFKERLHSYVITNAIADDNVLKFSVEYWGKLKSKDGSFNDEKVESINKKEFFEGDKRINDIVDWIIQNHNRKTHNKHFSSMLCVGSKDALIKYYQSFKKKKEDGLHDLRIVTVFTYGTNEEDAESNGLIGDPSFDPNKSDTEESKHSREMLEEFVADYNAMYQTQHSVKDSKAFYKYYKNIAKRMKDRDKEGFKDKDRADILLVVNMFLTGFDAKRLNTLYVDKNLKYHGLIQAFSRTNRILGELKSQGNIVCFRNLKDNADEAIALFSDKNAEEKILLEPYEDHVKDFNDGVAELKGLVLSPDAVNGLISEDDQLKFVQSFRKLIRVLNVLKHFTEFTWDDLGLEAQEFEDFKSKYLDLYDRSRSGNTEGASIIEEIDFELELIHRDEINVSYILQLLADLHARKEAKGDSQDFEKKKKVILDLLNNESQLRSKKELIERFINENMPVLKVDADIDSEFSSYWTEQKDNAIKEFCEAEGLDVQSVNSMIEEFNFSGKEPLRETVFSALDKKPKIKERKKIFERVLTKLRDLISTFEEGV